MAQPLMDYVVGGTCRDADDVLGGDVDGVWDPVSVAETRICELTSILMLQVADWSIPRSSTTAITPSDLIPASPAVISKKIIYIMIIFIRS
jgi:hypothetical protein